MAKAELRKEIAKLGSPTESVRRRARQRLSSYGPEAVPDLIQATHDPNPLVRWNSAWVLAGIKDDSAFEAIVSLCDDPDDVVAFEARVAAGVSRHPKVVQVLTRYSEEAKVERDGAYLGFMRLGLSLTEITALLPGSKLALRRQLAYCLRFCAEPEALDTARGLMNDIDREVSVIATDSVFWLEEEATTRCNA